jgi:hypothetical protein
VANRKYRSTVKRARDDDVVLEGTVTTNAAGAVIAIDFPGVLTSAVDVWNGIGEHRFEFQDAFVQFRGARLGIQKTTSDPAVRWYIKEFSTTSLVIQFTNLSSPPAAVDLISAVYYITATFGDRPQ